MAGLPPVTPFPNLPNPREYENLGDFERRIMGYPYRPSEDSIRKIRTRSRGLVQEYNQTGPGEEKRQREILDKLLHPSCKGKNIYIEPSFRVSSGINLKLGNNFYANFDCVLQDTGPIEFGDDCLLGPAVHVYSASHPLNAAYRVLEDKKNYYEITKCVKFGNRCQLGGACRILPGVTLGNNVIVEPGSVVTKSFPDNVVIAGNPAKIIRHMPPPEVSSSNSVKKDEIC